MLEQKHGLDSVASWVNLCTIPALDDLQMSHIKWATLSVESGGGQAARRFGSLPEAREAQGLSGSTQWLEGREGILASPGILQLLLHPPGVLAGTSLCRPSSH